METNHVDQNNGEVGGVGGDGRPFTILRPDAGIPSGILARIGNGQGP